MSEEVYTVEQFAERLKLHKKTVLRFIREGRLRAVKVGKSYRILRTDLEAMTGIVRGSGDAAARVTSIVDIPDVDPALAQHLARALPAVRMGQEAPAEPMSLDVAYDTARRHVKIVIVGSPADTASMLRMVQVLSER
ncbi:MAG TPA: helix-turn-helix domain-containing protein [Phenylobacterium sp.]|jgi:excisionase family DNA binding protein|uniref:helix-turn-helix domain-containing protein n=1 Tax=Phenylobacterium sp. TaxID=1871053 RepID=UPI002CA7146D|nr:helix-turn-helix domain-containing protein [Phenylobacterium sp.]HXA38066.1 helix-turn-helix domain-containing protein [Phenylobacterium sp.]